MRPAPRARRDDPLAFKTEYFAAFQGLEYEMVLGGWGLAHVESLNRWGGRDDLEMKHQFMCFVAEQFGFEQKCVPVGMSCGGLQAVKLAALHPELVSALYLDAPVINLLSCPFGMGIGTDIDKAAQSEALAALKLRRPEIIGYRDHPLDHLPALARARIPAVLVWGDADRTVPFEENGKYVLETWRREGIPLLTDRKAGVGHHPHGPSDLRRVKVFLNEHLRVCGGVHMTDH